MIIYKVLYFVKRRITKGVNKGGYEDIENREEVIINNFQSVIAKFKQYKNQWEQQIFYDGYFGRVQAFVPHIFFDGTLSNWPHSNEYIGHTWKQIGGKIEEQELMDEKFFIEKGELI